MKAARLLGLAVLALLGWMVIARKTGAIPSPAQIVAPQPIRVAETITVKPGQQMEWSLATPGGRAPGLLQGSWTAHGASANIKGANDDTLVGFTLRGPDNVSIQHLDHPTSGNFSIRYEKPGTYTFIFDNGGIIRSSARQVQIEGTYHPD
jgi:hypothetical protein